MVNHPHRSKKTRRPSPRYYLVPLPLTPETPKRVALECLVRSCDTWGVVRIMHAGGYEFWRKGLRVGKFDNLIALYDAIDKIKN
jgi:hypothetical protein